MKLHHLLIVGAWPLFGFAAPTPAEETTARVSNGVFVTKPYLQIGRNPSPTTLQLLWHAPDSEADWSVEYRTSGEPSWRKAESVDFRRVAVAGIEPHRVYRAALTGLASGGTFTYRVLKGGEAVFSAEGRAPKSADQPYRFVAFGDCGAGTPEQKPLAHRAFLSRPDLVVIPGDMVYEYGLISEYREKFWPGLQRRRAVRGRRPAAAVDPVRGRAGNHDTEMRDLDRYPDALAYFLYWDQPLNGPLGREGGRVRPAAEGDRGPTARAFAEAAGEAFPRMTNFSFDYGNAHWTIVDSNPYVDWTDPTLKEWVANDLAAAKDATWRFVAFHHPGFNSLERAPRTAAHAAPGPGVRGGQGRRRLQRPRPQLPAVVSRSASSPTSRARSWSAAGTARRSGAGSSTAAGRSTSRSTARTDTTPDGVIYIVTGAGGQKLYNPEQNDDPDSWQKFTDKFVSKVHSLTVADVDGKTLTVRQVTADGRELDRFTIAR